LRRIIGFSLSIASLLVANTAWSHALFDTNKTIKPRSNDDDLKTGPCGDIPASEDDTNRVSLIAGEKIDLHWVETIDHPGWFVLSFSPDGENDFDQNILAEKIIDDQNTAVSRSDPSTHHKFSHKITVPNVECEECSFQLIQVMTDRNPPTNYYSCADIRIVKSNEDKPSAPENLEVMQIERNDQ